MNENNLLCEKDNFDMDNKGVVCVFERDIDGVDMEIF